MLGPVFKNNNHWTLLFVNVKTLQVFYIDPFGALDYEVERVLMNWTKFCSKRAGLKKLKWMSSKTQHIIQSDQSSCGVLVSYFCQSMMEDGTGSLNDPEFDVDSFRISMKNILTNKN